ncbi:hypothetical protein FRC12_023641 [Ceratobasidium sp. 428]|nr:hypothetical protein FRC12_023641 [Ceratobasidium sp. 428]
MLSAHPPAVVCTVPPPHRPRGPAASAHRQPATSIRNQMQKPRPGSDAHNDQSPHRFEIPPSIASARASYLAASPATATASRHRVETRIQGSRLLRPVGLASGQGQARRSRPRCERKREAGSASLGREIHGGRTRLAASVPNSEASFPNQAPPTSIARENQIPPGQAWARPMPEQAQPNPVPAQQYQAHHRRRSSHTSQEYTQNVHHRASIPHP